MAEENDLDVNETQKTRTRLKRPQAARGRQTIKSKEKQIDAEQNHHTGTSCKKAGNASDAEWQAGSKFHACG